MNLTPLHSEHQTLGATMVEFAGWSMPLKYGSETAEHHAVRDGAGLFDLSHMAQISVRGPEAARLLDYACVSELSTVDLWAAKYSMMCDEHGGVIDDLVVYRRDWDHFVVVANAANRTSVMDEFLMRGNGLDASVTDLTDRRALIAVQGPLSADIVRSMCERGSTDVMTLKYYRFANVVLVGGIHAVVSRTGYTGEDGFELYVDADDAVAVWRLALALGEPAGVVPCGLAARDSLRLEAGMPLYGQELSPDSTPVDAGLARIVHLDGDREFVGRHALEVAVKQGPTKALVGLVGQSMRGPRSGYPVLDEGGNQIGMVTSGLPSPTLGVAVALAYVPPAVAAPGTTVEVDVRGRTETMTVSALPLYRRGA